MVSPQNHLAAGFLVWAAKPGVDLTRSRSERRAHGEIFELTSGQMEVEKKPCLSDAFSSGFNQISLE